MCGNESQPQFASITLGWEWALLPVLTGSILFRFQTLPINSLRVAFIDHPEGHKNTAPQMYGGRRLCRRIGGRP